MIINNRDDEHPVKRKEVLTRVLCCEYDFSTELTNTEGPLDTDVNLVIGMDKIECHKLVISTYSEVLAKFIAQDPQIRDIPIPSALNISPLTLRAAIRFLYTSELVAPILLEGGGTDVAKDPSYHLKDISLAFLESLKHAAQKLKIAILLAKCERLQEWMREESVKRAGGGADEHAGTAKGVKSLSEDKSTKIHSTHFAPPPSSGEIASNLLSTDLQQPHQQDNKPQQDLSRKRLSIYHDTILENKNQQHEFLHQGTVVDHMRYREFLIREISSSSKILGHPVSGLTPNNFDAIVIVEGIKFPVHLKIVQAVSPYLKQCFDQQNVKDKLLPKPPPILMMDENQDIKIQTYLPTIYLPLESQITPKIFDSILLFAYSKKLDLGPDDLQGMAKACTYLTIPGLKKLVEHYAEICKMGINPSVGNMNDASNLVNTSNTTSSMNQIPYNLPVYQHQQRPDMHQIGPQQYPWDPTTISQIYMNPQSGFHNQQYTQHSNTAANTFIPPNRGIEYQALSNDVQNIQMNSFKHSDFKSIYQLLSQSNYSSLRGSEDKLFDIAMNWLKWDLNGRIGYLDKLMNCIQFDSMSLEQLNNCYKICQELLSVSPFLQNKFISAYNKFHQLKSAHK